MKRITYPTKKRTLYHSFDKRVPFRYCSITPTILLARILMPELFGLYNLALSTIFLFSAISNLGIGETVITFVSKELGKNKKKSANLKFPSQQTHPC